MILTVPRCLQAQPPAPFQRRSGEASQVSGSADSECAEGRSAACCLMLAMLVTDSNFHLDSCSKFEALNCNVMLTGHATV